MKPVAIILTFNEARHIERCISSLRAVCDRIVVVDSYSTDETTKLARRMGAEVIEHRFTTHAAQFNWALATLGTDTGWVLRVDADEYLTQALASEILDRLPELPPGVRGVRFRRRMAFQRRLIRHGGLFPVEVVRLFRIGYARYESRWMDEHMVVNGETITFAGEIIDDSLVTLVQWTSKHNEYSSREAIEVLDLELGFLGRSRTTELEPGSQAARKRWLKESAYAQLPTGLRALLYFVYRYVVRLGFLDGPEGRAFHCLQGLWYRYLVDAKVAEVKRFMHREGASAEAAIVQVLGIDLTEADSTD